jgi:hypothetical protein
MSTEINEMNGTNEVNGTYADTNVTTIKRTLDPEELERRNAVKAANREASQPFVPQAVIEVANGLGIELDVFKQLYPKFNDMKKAVEAKALAMYKATIKGESSHNRSTNGAPTPKWLKKSKAAFMRAMVFSFNHRIKGQLLSEVIEDAWKTIFTPESELVENFEAILKGSDDASDANDTNDSNDSNDSSDSASESFV